MIPNEYSGKQPTLPLSKDGSINRQKHDVSNKLAKLILAVGALMFSTGVYFMSQSKAFSSISTGLTGVSLSFYGTIISLIAFSIFEAKS